MSADLVPNEVFQVEIMSLREQPPTPEYLEAGGDPDDWESPYCYASCKILAAEDPELNNDEVIGRFVDMTMLNQWQGRKGLHSVLYDPEEGWKDGIPVNEAGERRTENLKGVKFIGKVREYESKKGKQQEIRPLLYKK
jgi:hypothetical protein